MLHGRVALVTGAAQGLGKAFAEILLQKGSKACVADVNAIRGQDTVQGFNKTYGEGSALFVQCDVTNQGQFEGAFKKTKEEFKNIDIVVNSAGVVDEPNWERTLAINLHGTMRGTNLATEYMRTDNGGRGGLIINVASTAGLQPLPFSPAYSASKAGVISYTRCWAQAIKKMKTGVKCACICPAFTKTEILESEGVLFPEFANKLMEKIGIMEISKVADAFKQLIENPDNNGAVLSIDSLNGAQYRYTSMDSKM